jgi:polygalacturonase
MNINSSRLLIFILTLVLFQTVSAKDYKASLFGIKSDGATLNTGSIQKAINFISENGGGRLVFYVGRYLTGTIQLKSNVTIQLEEGAILVGTASIYDYDAVKGQKALVIANHQQNIGIAGKGVIEGQGTKVLEQIKTQIEKGNLKETANHASPALIAMDSCSQINLEEINLVNACGNVQTFTGCRDLSIRGITVKSKIVPDSTGIVLSDCEDVKLNRIFFDTSGIEIKSEGNLKNITIVDCLNVDGKKITVP